MIPHTNREVTVRAQYFTQQKNKSKQTFWGLDFNQQWQPSQQGLYRLSAELSAKSPASASAASRAVGVRCLPNPQSPDWNHEAYYNLRQGKTMETRMVSWKKHDPQMVILLLYHVTERYCLWHLQVGWYWDITQCLHLVFIDGPPLSQFSFHTVGPTISPGITLFHHLVLVIEMPMGHNCTCIRNFTCTSAQLPHKAVAEVSK